MRLRLGSSWCPLLLGLYSDGLDSWASLSFYVICVHLESDVYSGSYVTINKER